MNEQAQLKALKTGAFVFFVFSFWVYNYYTDFLYEWIDMHPRPIRAMNAVIEYGFVKPLGEPFAMIALVGLVLLGTVTAYRRALREPSVIQRSR
jgi:hypothetical protein